MKKLFFVLFFILVSSIFCTEADKIRKFSYCVASKVKECIKKPHCPRITELINMIKEMKIESLKDLKKVIAAFMNIPEVKDCYDKYIK